MVSQGIRAARLAAPLAWGTVLTGAFTGWLSVGGIVATTGLLLTAGTRDAIRAADQHDKELLLGALLANRPGDAARGRGSTTLRTVR